MSLIKSSLSALAAALLAVPAFSASPILVATGFDSGEFTAGDLNNQNGWTVVQGTATVQGAVIEDGDQAVSLAANTIVDRAVTDNSTVVWTETYFRGAGTDQTPSYPSSPAASAIVHFSSGGNIEAGLDGPGIFLANGDGTGGIDWEAGVQGALDPNAWYQVTIRQDYTAKTWDCYLNGDLVGSGLGFRDDSVERLSGFRQYSGVQSYMDTFLIQRANFFDLNLDGSTNVQDVVLNVNADGLTVEDAGPIIFGDFDNNGDGQVNNDDALAVVEAILNAPIQQTRD